MSGVQSKEGPIPKTRKRRTLTTEDSIEISEEETQNFLRIDSLSLPKVLKKALKILRAISKFLKAKENLEVFRDT